MPAIYFKLSAQHEKTLKTLMKEEGYTSKAEFFRFLLRWFHYYKLQWEAERRTNDYLKKKHNINL